MKLVLLAALIFSATFARAGTAPAESSPVHPAFETEIREIQDAFNAAWLRHDAAVLERIVADDFRGITGGGKTINKADLIAFAMHSDETSTDLSDRTVRLFGDVAIATNRITDRGTKADGRTFTVVSCVTSVFVWRPAGWRLVAEQETIPGR